MRYSIHPDESVGLGSYLRLCYGLDWGHWQEMDDTGEYDRDRGSKGCYQEHFWGCWILTTSSNGYRRGRLPQAHGIHQSCHEVV